MKRGGCTQKGEGGGGGETMYICEKKPRSCTDLRWKVPLDKGRSIIKGAVCSRGTGRRGDEGVRVCGA